MNEGLRKTLAAMERFVNIVAAVAAGIALITAGVAVITGHWDWRTAFFIALAAAVVSIAVSLYQYRSRVAIRTFRGVSKADRMRQADQYAAKRIAEARRSVWDFSWQDDIESNPKTDLQSPTRSAGAKALDDAIRSAIIDGQIEYHEILTTRAYCLLLKKHLSYCREVPKDKTIKYRARIYDNTREEYRKFPKIQFVIIDEEEVIFLSSGYEYCFSMRSKRTASVFLKYATMAWEQADEWKQGCKDVVLGGAIVQGFDKYLENLERSIFDA